MAVSRARDAASRNRGGDAADDSPCNEVWLFAQAVLGKPVLAQSQREADAIAQRKLREFVDDISPPQFGTRSAAGPSNDARLFAEAVRGEPVITEEEQRRWLAEIATVYEGSWDPIKHPKGAFPENRGWWSPTGGSQPEIGGAGKLASFHLNANATARPPFLTVSARKPTQGSDSGAPRHSVANAKPSDGSHSQAPHIPPRPTLNSEGVEVAGAGPETTQTYKDKVQKALETLDPQVARWWKANSVNGQIRSRAAGWLQFKYHSWLTGDAQPIIEIDQSFTPGQAAQAIIAEVQGGWFADSIGAFYKKYKFAQTGDIEEFRKWQQGATGEAARLASVLAELYVSSIAALTPAGDLVVTLGDLADNGPRWDQLASILPLIGHLPIGAIILKLGSRQVKVPKALARKLEHLTDSEWKSILVAVAGAKTDDEAAAIIKREVARHVGDRQIHHAISDTVHKALEEHKNLRGKYQLRDKRFERLATDYEAHHGYEAWHRELDKEVKDWIERNKNATEATFEAWLRERYARSDLKRRFPKGF